MEKGRSTAAAPRSSLIPCGWEHPLHGRRKSPLGEATPHLTTERITGKRLAADKPEDRALQERCITSDNMFVPSVFYNNYHQIVQAPGYVVILSESMHDARIIPLDCRPRLGVNIQQWFSHSRGWWEGGDVGPETTNFNDERRFQGLTKDFVWSSASPGPMPTRLATGSP